MPDIADDLTTRLVLDDLRPRLSRKVRIVEIADTFSDAIPQGRDLTCVRVVRNYMQAIYDAGLDTAFQHLLYLEPVESTGDDVVAWRSVVLREIPPVWGRPDTRWKWRVETPFVAQCVDGLGMGIHADLKKACSIARQVNTAARNNDRMFETAFSFRRSRLYDCFGLRLELLNALPTQWVPRHRYSKWLRLGVRFPDKAKPEINLPMLIDAFQRWLYQGDVQFAFEDQKSLLRQIDWDISQAAKCLMPEDDEALERMSA